MHAHIQEIERALRSMQEITNAFWGGRHPQWTSEKEERFNRKACYQHVFEGRLPFEPSDTSDATAWTASFTWIVRIDWRLPQPEHEFATCLTLGSRVSLVERISLSSRSATLLHAETPLEVEDDHAMLAWRRAHRNAAAKLGLELPTAFNRPNRPSETYSVQTVCKAGVTEYAHSLGRLILDELCRVPLPHGV